MKHLPPIFLFLIFLITPIRGFGQKKLKNHVQSKMSVINSISPDSISFKDLMPIGEAIGASTIVMLGEQAHGDGATFEAKSRLVKYLHEKKGFNVLVFESDFFALTEGWENLGKDKKSITRFFKENLYPVWSYCPQCSDLLYSYIPKSYQDNNPLTVAGFDSQFHGRYTADSIKSYLTSFLQTNHISYASSEEFESFFLPFLDSLSKFNRQKSGYLDSLSRSNFAQNYIRFDNAIDIINKEISPKLDSTFASVILENYKVFARGLRYFGKDTLRDSRDIRMGENLRWLAEVKFPGQKIIVWAADSHIMKNGTTMIKRKIPYLQSMGNQFVHHNDWEKKTYIIGFTSAYGISQTAYSTRANHIKPPKQGFENWVNKDINYGFVDFRNFNKNNPGYSENFKLKALGHGSLNGVWTNVFDGIFYIREMLPCTSK